MKNIIMITILIFSNGMFFYTYGKIYYDFPFSIFTYSISLLTLLLLKKKIHENWSWFMFCFFCGFHLSWKPYNVFSLTGLALILLSHDESREMMLPFLSNKIKLLTGIIAVIVGYLLGNYNLLLQLAETLKGLLAYPAQSKFWDFLFEPMIIWDHVSGIPFNVAIVPVMVVLIFFFCVPSLVNNIKYLSTSLFMLLCLFVFIEKFSLGFPWHGFPFGLFILTFSAFVLQEVTTRRSMVYGICVLGLCIQCVNAVRLIGIQHECYDITNQAVMVMDNKIEDIKNEINNLLIDIEKGSDYRIESAIKRFKYIKTMGQEKYTLEYYGNVMGVESEFKQIYLANPNSVNKYLIYVEPNIFQNMPKDIRVPLIDLTKVLRTISKEDYTIKLILNP